jgi:hypothetical protein
MVPTGYVPTFFDEFVANKLPFPKTKFKPPEWALAQVIDKKKSSLMNLTVNTRLNRNTFVF